MKIFQNFSRIFTQILFILDIRILRENPKDLRKIWSNFTSCPETFHVHPKLSQKFYKEFLKFPKSSQKFCKEFSQFFSIIFGKCTSKFTRTLENLLIILLDLDMSILLKNPNVLLKIWSSRRSRPESSHWNSEIFSEVLQRNLGIFLDYFRQFYLKVYEDSLENFLRILLDTDLSILRKNP